MFNYEWVHYLVHSDYRPRSKAFRAVWRNHRLHHYKNEHYWFTVTTSGTADRLFGTYPDSGEVRPRRPCAQLHALEDGTRRILTAPAGVSRARSPTCTGRTSSFQSPNPLVRVIGLSVPVYSTTSPTLERL